MNVSSATILHFPRRAPVQAATAPVRLGAGIEALDTALAAQREALRDWRYAVAELQLAVASLGCSVQAYQATLGTLAEDVAALGGEARKLQSVLA